MSPHEPQMSSAGKMHAADRYRFDLLLGRLRTADGAVQAEALGQLEDARAVTLLLTALQDTNQGIRVVAAEILGRLRDLQAVAPLVMLLQGREAAVRKAAAGALDSLAHQYPDAFEQSYAVE